MLSIRLLLSNSYDPWFNLSLEEYIFQNMEQNQSILFLWRNQNTVVIGRAQNAWKECNTRRMARDGIRLARRSTGGGAVFHDLGNTCFTFMSSQKNYSNDVSFKIILKGLQELGINALISGRNDIIIETKEGNRKISGSAYREASDRKLHHGTILLNVDMNKLIYYLNPDDKKLKTKGITSIRSRVANLQELNHDINHQILCQKLTESFFQYYGMTTKSEVLIKENFFHIKDFSKQFNKQCCWDWNFGNTPKFTHQLDKRFDWGSVEFYFDVEHGMISNSYIFTDSLNPEPLEKFSNQLVGILYTPQSIQDFYNNRWIKNHFLFEDELIEVLNWLIHEIK